MITEVGEKMIKKMGYNVLIANNGKEALEIYRVSHGSIDVVILDMVMPEMGGVELSRRLLQSRAQMRVLYMSGFPEDGAVDRGALDPGVPFLQKPFTARELFKKTREALDH